MIPILAPPVPHFPVKFDATSPPFTTHSVPFEWPVEGQVDADDSESEQESHLKWDLRTDREQYIDALGMSSIWYQWEDSVAD